MVIPTTKKIKAMTKMIRNKIASPIPFFFLFVVEVANLLIHLRKFHSKLNKILWKHPQIIMKEYQ